MFKINLLGPPGIQPDIVNNYISFDKDDKKNKKKVVLDDKSSIITKLLDYVPSGTDYLSIIMLTFIIVLFILIRQQNITIPTNKIKKYHYLSINESELESIYSEISQIISELKNNNKISIFSLITNKDKMKFKLISNNQNELQSLINKMNELSYVTSRIYGDSTSTFILSSELPWKIISNNTNELNIIEHGQFSSIIILLEDLILNRKLHKGKLNLLAQKDDLYKFKFIISNN